MLRRVALVRADVSEEHSASLIRGTTFGETGTTLILTSNRCKQQINTMTEALSSSETSEAFFIVSVVKISNLTGTYLLKMDAILSFQTSINISQTA
jgi:hypothetical protein